MVASQIQASSREGWWERLTQIRPDERRVLLLAGGYFGFLMMAYYLLRPLRETMGIARGADKLPWLMTGTLLVVVLANPAFAALVSRLPRRRFIPWIYRCFAAQLLIFAGCFQWIPPVGRVWLGYIFYVWLSVFNLFVVSIFWGFMADLFDEGQGKRLFAVIAVGGTLGALVGAGVTEALTRGTAFGLSFAFRATPPMLVVLATVLLELAVRCALALARHFQLGNRAGGPREPGPGPLEGIRLLGQSRYLQLIAGYILLFTLATTFLYMAQGSIVAKTYASQADRTAAFARIDFWTNFLTLVTQLFLTGRLIRRFGLKPMILLLPLVSLAGFGVLWIWPTFAVLAVFQVLRRGLHYAVDRPVREVLYIPLSADAKYKAKPFIDTFIYRGGDFLGAWAPTVLGWILIPAAGAALGVTALWCGLGAKLGNRQREVFGE